MARSAAGRSGFTRECVATSVSPDVDPTRPALAEGDSHAPIRRKESVVEGGNPGGRHTCQRAQRYRQDTACAMPQPRPQPGTQPRTCLVGTRSRSIGAGQKPAGCTQVGQDWVARQRAENRRGWRGLLWRAWVRGAAPCVRFGITCWAFSWFAFLSLFSLFAFAFRSSHFPCLSAGVVVSNPAILTPQSHRKNLELMDEWGLNSDVHRQRIRYRHRARENPPGTNPL